MCYDAFSVEAWSRRDSRNPRTGLSDPEARVWRGRKRFFLGYKIHCSGDWNSEMPTAYVVAPANENEKKHFKKIASKVRERFPNAKWHMADNQYSSKGLRRYIEEELKCRVNPPDVLTVKDRIDVEGPEWKRVVYKRLRAMVEGLNGRAKSRLAYQRLTWQGLENASTHVSLVLMVAYAVCIAACLIGRPELRQSVTFSPENSLRDGRRDRGCHTSFGVGEAVCGIGSPSLTVFR